MLREGSLRLRGVAEAEALDGLRADATLAEVGKTHRTPFLGLGKLRLEVLRCVVIDDKEALTLAIALLLLFAFFALDDLDVVLLCQVLERIRIGELLVLHDEVQRRTAFATGEALTDILSGIDVEGGIPIAMEGAQPDVAHTLAA